MKSKIVTKEELKNTVGDLKDRGKVIVATSGCFDILHSGHIAYLEAARNRGDVLIVFLNADLSVRRLKGEKRPITGEQERALIIAGLGCVDYVCIFGDSTPCNMIEYIKPDIFVKGGDYEKQFIPEMDSVKKYGGRVEYLLTVPGCSTTNIIERILKIYNYTRGI